MTLFRIKGVCVKLDPLLLLLSAFWIITGYWRTAVSIYLMLILHEMGHLLAALTFNVKVHQIELLPFGSALRLDDIFEGHPVKETVIALAGPAVSAVCALCCCVLRIKTPFMPELLQQTEQAATMITCFNLLPVLPLDGGRVLRAVISRKCDFGRATRIASVLGIIMGATLTGYGVYSFFTPQADAVMPMLGVFLLFSAIDEFKQGKFELARSILARHNNGNDELYSVKEVAVKESMTVLNAMRMLGNDDRYYIFRVLDRDMKYKGTFDETVLQQAALSMQTNGTVGELISGEYNGEYS